MLQHGSIQSTCDSLYGLPTISTTYSSNAASSPRTTRCTDYRLYRRHATAMQHPVHVQLAVLTTDHIDDMLLQCSIQSTYDSRYWLPTISTTYSSNAASSPRTTRCTDYRLYRRHATAMQHPVHVQLAVLTTDYIDDMLLQCSIQSTYDSRYWLPTISTTYSSNAASSPRTTRCTDYWLYRRHATAMQHPVHVRLAVRTTDYIDDMLQQCSIQSTYNSRYWLPTISTTYSSNAASSPRTTRGTDYRLYRRHATAMQHPVHVRLAVRTTDYIDDMLLQCSI